MSAEKDKQDQINRIEAMLEDMLKVLNGEKGRIGLYGKVDIMWQYRNIFIGLFAANVVTLIVAAVKLLQQTTG